MCITQIEVTGDSQLIVNQVQEEWNESNPKMEKRHSRVTSLITIFEEFEVNHRVRVTNKRADKLVNEAFDQHIG